MLYVSDKLDNICEELHSKFSKLGMNVTVRWSFDNLNSNPRNLDEYYRISILNEVKSKDFTNVHQLMVTIHRVMLDQTSEEDIVKNAFTLLLHDLANCV